MELILRALRMTASTDSFVVGERIISLLDAHNELRLLNTSSEDVPYRDGPRPALVRMNKCTVTLPCFGEWVGRSFTNEIAESTTGVMIDAYRQITPDFTELSSPGGPFTFSTGRVSREHTGLCLSVNGNCACSAANPFSIFLEMMRGSTDLWSTISITSIGQIKR